MPWPVYSRRFISGAGPATLTYTVPAGHVAVLKHGAFMSSSGAAGSADVQVNGRYCYVVAFQAAVGTTQWPTMVVANEGEQIKCALSAATIHATLSGYLFKTAPVPSMDDPGQERDVYTTRVDYEEPKLE